MTDSIKSDQLKFIIKKILAFAADAKEMAKNEGKTPFYQGLMQAYYEVLDTMQDQMIIDETDLKEFGLDIKLEDIFG